MASRPADRLGGSRFALVALAISVLLEACVPAGPTTPALTGVPAGPRPVAVSGPPVNFSWVDMRGAAFTPHDLQGRISVLAFVTTYDMASHAQVRHLSRLLTTHVPRLNVVLVVLEPPENRPLVDAFESTLDVPLTVVLADAQTIRGEGAFAGLHHVPSVVILDRAGVERFRHLGLIEGAPIEEAVVRVESETGVRAGQSKSPASVDADAPRASPKN